MSMGDVSINKPSAITESFHGCSIRSRIQTGYSYVPEDVIYAVLFTDMFSVNYKNAIKIVRVALEKNYFVLGPI
jgi:hypothetical protein